MNPRQKNEGEKSHSTSYESAKAFFEHNDLKCTVEEIYKVQQHFHRNMLNMVHAFEKIKFQLPEKSQRLLDELLISYKTLSANLFSEPSGDLEKDIIHIIEVINKQNEKFQVALSAFFESIANLDIFNDFLKQYEKEQQFVIEIKKLINNQSWLNVQLYVNQPLQNLTQCKLLVEKLKKHLLESGCNESILDKTDDSYNHIVEEVKRINDYKETIALLNKIYQTLTHLLADEISKVESTIPNKSETDLECLQSEQTPLIKHIETAMISTKKGITKIINGTQDVLSLHRGLLDLLTFINNAYPKKHTFFSASQCLATKSYQLFAYPFSILTMKEAEKNPRLGEQLKINLTDPHEQLNQIIIELSNEIKQAESLIIADEVSRQRYTN